MNRLGFWLVSIAIALYVLASCVFVVDQRQVGVLYSFGQIKTVKTEPGLYAKLPKPFENVVFLDKRILTLDGDERGSIQTAEKKNVVVDWLVKWRIVDARQFIRNSGTNTSNVEQRLTSIVQDALNTEITKRSVRAVLSDEREAVMQGVQRRLIDDAKAFGIEIVDMRIKRVDFPGSVVDSVYQRMQSERQQVASQLRATGEAEGEQLRANAERQRDEILATAFSSAEKIKGDADGQANAIYAAAFGKDPSFANFYRNLQAYKASFNSRSDVVVTDGSSEFFRVLRSGGKGN